MHLSHFPPVPPSTESETLNKQTSTSVSQCWEWNLKQANQYLCLPVLRVKPQTSEPVLFSPSSKSETSNKRKVQSTLLLVNHCRLGTNIWKQYSSFSWYWNLSKWTWYYHKHTKTGQYVLITSYTLWRWKTSWIRSLVIRAQKICSANYFKKEIQLIKRYAAWNGYTWNVNCMHYKILIITRLMIMTQTLWESILRSNIPRKQQIDWLNNV